MKIANEFTVSVPIDKAWDVLTDLEQVIPLMPGASLTGREGDDVLGKVKLKVGPVTSEFNGKAHFVERDDDAHRAVIDGRGKESRGSGNAAATVTAQLHDAGDQTRVTVDTDLKVVGKLAQFGSGMLQQVSEKLLGEFVQSLEAKLAAPEATPVVDAAANGAVPSPDGAAAQQPPAPAPAQTPVTPRAEAAPIDLLELAGGGMLKKYGTPIAAAFALAALIFTLGRLRIARNGRR